MNQSRRGRPPHRFSPLHDDGSYLSPAKQQQQQLPYSLWCLQPDKPKNTKKMNGLKDSSLSLSSAFCTSVSVYVQTSSSSTSFPTPHPIAHLTGFSQLGRTVKYRPPFLLPKSLVETVISRVIDTVSWLSQMKENTKKGNSRNLGVERMTQFSLEFLFLWVFFWFIQLSIRIFPKLLFWGVCLFFSPCVGLDVVIVGRDFQTKRQ